MALIPIDILTAQPTTDEVFDKLLDALEVAGVPARSWRVGGVARSLLGCVALLYSQIYTLVANTTAGNFLFFGTGDFLTAHARDLYAVDRIPATFASAAAPMGVTLTNSGGAIYTQGADELIVSSSTTKARFTVSIPFTLNAFSSLNVDVRAVVSGAASSVAPGELDTLETPLTGVTCTNPFAILGQDQESDEALVQRCLAKKGTFSPFGPRDAYQFAALSAELSPGVPTTINRVSVSKFSSTGQVTVTCATPSGTPSGAELAAVTANVEAIARPDTVQAFVRGVTTLNTAKTITIWSKGGTASLLAANAGVALANMIKDYPIGGLTKNGSSFFLFDDHIRCSVEDSSPTIYSVDLSPAGDILMGPTDVIVDASTFVVRIT